MDVDFGSWSILTTNFLIVLFIALGGVTFSSVLHLCNGKWRFQIRNLACSFAVLFPVAFVMLVILLINGEATFPWLAEAHGDGHGDGGHHLSGWHNYSFLVAREIIGFIVVTVLYGLFIKYQHASKIDNSYVVQRRFRNIALLIPFAYFIYGTMVAWDFEMTMVPGWHSAVYGAYHFQSNFHMFLAFFTIFLFFMKRSGSLTKPFRTYIFNYMAQMMFAMTILWTYLYFSQYVLMWYGRLPVETDRYDSMIYEGFGTLWITFVTFKFLIPFVTFVFTPNRHNPVTITLVSVFIVVGTWLERYIWISGSVDSQYYRMPLSTMFGIVVTIATVVFSWILVNATLNRYGLVKSNK